MLDLLLARYGDDEPYPVARVYAWRGDRDRAFEWLDRAIAQRQRPRVLAAVHAVSEVRRLRIRDDPRFAALLGRMNLPAG